MNRLLGGRRRFFAAGLALLSFGRRVWAQAAVPPGPVRYAALTRPVTIPVEAVTQPWRPVPFVAESRGAGGRRVLINGILYRTETELSALCVTCPHEQCQVDLVTDVERLARMTPRLRLGQGSQAQHPLFECGCHFSVFDAADAGARLSGEAPRGLFRFRIARVRDGVAEITDIEEAALPEV
jgi:Rieske Fe-S protein